MDKEGMLREARELAAIAPNINVKIPMTPEGLSAVSVLAGEGIRTNVTLVFSANQAMLAADATAIAAQTRRKSICCVASTSR